MKLIFYFLAVSFTLGWTICNGQDIVVREDGTRQKGRITYEDSSMIIFVTRINDKEKEIGIQKSKIKELIRDKNNLFLLPAEALNESIYLNVDREYMAGKYVLTEDNLKKLLARNFDAKEMYNKSKTSNIIGTLLGFTGGFIMGDALGREIFRKNEKFKTKNFLIGTGVTLVGISFALAGTNQRKSAIKIYNHSLKKNNSLGYMEPVKLAVYPNGISLTF